MLPITRVPKNIDRMINPRMHHYGTDCPHSDRVRFPNDSGFPRPENPAFSVPASLPQKEFAMQGLSYVYLSGSEALPIECPS